MDPNRKYWNEKVETMSAEELFGLESEKLVKEVGYVYRNSPFYRAKFREIGLEPEEIKTRDDIVKLPFTSKDDLRRTQAEDGGLGGHRCAPKSDLVRIQGTSGTTGRPLYIGLTRHDADVWKELFARHAWTGAVVPVNHRARPHQDECCRPCIGFIHCEVEVREHRGPVILPKLEVHPFIRAKIPPLSGGLQGAGDNAALLENIEKAPKVLRRPVRAGEHERIRFASLVHPRKNLIDRPIGAAGDRC